MFTLWFMFKVGICVGAIGAYINWCNEKAEIKMLHEHLEELKGQLKRLEGEE